MIAVALRSLFVAFSGAAVPGPLFALTLNQALLVGWTAGVWLMVGHMLVELGVVAMLRLGLAEVLKRRAVNLAVSLIGGAVLLYFAWGMADLALRGQLTTAGDPHAPALSAGMLVVQGAVMSLANPYWHLWWATVGVGLVAAQLQTHGARVWPAFFLGHISGDYLWYVGVSLLAGFGGHFLSPAVHRAIILTCAAGIALLGVLFLVRPLRERWRAS